MHVNGCRKPIPGVVLYMLLGHGRGGLMARAPAPCAQAKHRVDARANEAIASATIRLAALTATTTAGSTPQQGRVGLGAVAMPARLLATPISVSARES